ncbi:hypothetical protein L202_01073 [Cryptococcus amylolentus CBS 6039]|uniref:Sodium/calcium exchanger membrane region domain-containing protein n=2 Tax=Cryptococcus amylolentus TaxID=104669 RepID=A0A1E3I4Q2_9TREE|nr:hypothetical protein L202_01073 [Cryptococcus amylolentus CBS 6039]ODN82801.1 hypothetical protein L202_01073 [Cryptococcus amylolentus CBS 6039]ODO10468.1 hypothetical protein I350_01063 [Cryptococcus amylolentus CBS 6273]
MVVLTTRNRKRAWFLLTATVSIHIILLTVTRRLSDRRFPKGGGLIKRFIDDHDASGPLDFPYIEWYNALPPAWRPFFIILLLCILAFLFSFIGISASDFFCPNLATVAAYLGLNESTAGVTFLAFGNGSPDVFSTFSAMSNGTVGLAVGELIGAASFIVSIVVGSIAFIGPFQVPRHAFRRDVAFFTTAVLVLIITLHDGQLTLFESGGMVGLYLLYVAVVVSENWWKKRKRRWIFLGKRRGTQSREGSGDTAKILASLSPHPELERPPPVPITNHDSTSLSPTVSSRRRSHSSSHLTARHLDPLDTPTPRANMSLLGAIEFRDVVNSLRKEGGSIYSGQSSRSTSPTGTVTPRMTGRERGDYFGNLGHRRSSSHTLGRGGPGTPGGSSRRIRSNSVRRSSSQMTDQSPERDRRMTLPTRHSYQGGSPAPVGLGISNTPESNPWHDQPGNPPTPSPHLQLPPTSPTKPSLPKLVIPDDNIAARKVPSISVLDPSGQTASPIPASPPLTSKRKRASKHVRAALKILFPSMQSFRHKSILGMALAIITVPQVLALTLTLPVVDDGHEMEEGEIRLDEGEGLPLHDSSGSDGEGEGESDGEGGDDEDDEADRLLDPHVGEELHHLVDHGFSPLHSPLGRIHHSAMRKMGYHAESGGLSPVRSEEYAEGEGDEHLDEIYGDVEGSDGKGEECEGALEFNKYLTAVQCVLGPLFCCFITFNGLSSFKWIALGTTLAGLIASVPVIRYASDGTAQPWRLVRCFCGFTCSMVWIAAIADMVVDVLDTVGEILGLSDAIIGLTIFAVGNSLADLVANVTVAQFAPTMAYGACFGGPMLNLLLGIGGSGSYHIITSASHKPVSVDFSPTLWVSATGLVVILLATAVWVPVNGYVVDKRWAGCLIVAYVVLMSVNVGVELKTGRS